MAGKAVMEGNVADPERRYLEREVQIKSSF